MYKFTACITRTVMIVIVIQIGTRTATIVIAHIVTSTSTSIAVRSSRPYTSIETNRSVKTRFTIPIAVSTLLRHLIIGRESQTLPDRITRFFSIGRFAEGTSVGHTVFIDHVQRYTQRCITTQFSGHHHTIITSTSSCIH